jgi:hypothetical protein
MGHRPSSSLCISTMLQKQHACALKQLFGRRVSEACDLRRMAVVEPLADLNTHNYLRQAVHAALDGVQIRLLHEFADFLRRPVHVRRSGSSASAYGEARRRRCRSSPALPRFVDSCDSQATELPPPHRSPSFAPHLRTARRRRHTGHHALCSSAQGRPLILEPGRARTQAPGPPIRATSEASSESNPR